jgi:hypothetical protein
MMKPAQDIVAWCGADDNPMRCIHFPYFAAKACNGEGGRISVKLMTATMAASIELCTFHAAVAALMNGDRPNCSDFDLQRWCLDQFIDPSTSAARPAVAHEPETPATRERSRSRGGARGDASVKGGKGSGKGGGQSKSQRSGLEPSVIRFLRAWYKRDWHRCSQIADDLYWSRDNIRREVDKHA